jgi:signal transduction histidine kinase
MPNPHATPSLRTELLAGFAMLAGAALVVAMASAPLFIAAADTSYAHMFVGALIAADIGVLVAFGAHHLRRLVTRPLEEVVAVAEAIAAGDLDRRVPAGRTREFAVLSASLNRLTDHLLAAQEQRVRAEKMATVGRLAAGIAHEIGNPLGAVNGYTHILRGRMAGDEVAAQALAGIERESARVDRIVRGLLDYARPRRGTPTHVGVNDAARFAASLLAEQGRLRGVTVHLTLDAADPQLVGERHEVEQLFVNLLLNAVDAIGETLAGGGGTLSVSTSRIPSAALRDGVARRADDPPVTAVRRAPSPRVDEWLARVQPPADVIKVVVSDSGPGVPEEDAERIFDPFYTTKEPGKGTGLGLAIVARIVDNLQGTIWVQRAREGGAAFHVLFPVALGPATAARRTVAAPVLRPAVAP